MAAPYLDRGRNAQALFILIGAVLAAVLAFGPAQAAAAQPIQAADLSDLRAKGRVNDTVLDRRPMRARIAAARAQEFVDPHGHRITVTTDIPDLDLAPYATVLAGTVHYGEIEDLVVEVVRPEQVGAICQDPEAVACYLADDPASSYKGRMWIPSHDDDLPHTLVHEYGHHVDNQLLNLGHFGGDCDFDNDGSRNWFFVRDVDGRIFEGANRCAPDAGWEELLGELYAEDYTWLNGNREWRYGFALGPPSEGELEALAEDFAYPFEPTYLRWSRSIGRRRGRSKFFTVEDWTFLTIRLRGPRRADLDLRLYRKGARRPLARSVRGGSRERIEKAIRPGRYEAFVSAVKRRGRARMRIDLK